MADPFSGGIMPQVIQNRQGLQGLEINKLAMEQQQQQMQQQQAQQQREAEAEQLLSKFQQGGGTDYNLVNQAVLKSPTAAKNVLATIGIADKAQKQRAANDIVTLMAALDDPNAFNREMAKRISTVIDNNGNPAHSKDLTKTYQEQGKDAAKRELQIVGAALANEGFLKPEMIGLGAAEGMTAFQQASTDLRKQELDFNKQQKQLDLQLKVLESQMKREDNDLKKQELQLKIEDQKQKIVDAGKQRETAANEKTAGLESARSNLDNMLNTLARVENTDLGVIKSATGPIDQMLPTLRQGTADFEELVGTLGSQAFLSQIPLIKGMGQLSNAEGEKLQSALQNFSLRQSPERLKENLAEARRLLTKARANIAKQYGAKETKPDTPATQTGSNVVDWSSM